MSAWTYRVFDATGRLIYVGSTTNLFTRLATHRAQSWWAFQAARVKARVHPSIEVARAAEQRAIAAENPRWNVLGRWGNRGGWTPDDYRDYCTAIVMKGSSRTAYNRAHLARVCRESLTLFGVDPAVPPVPVGAMA